MINLDKSSKMKNKLILTLLTAALGFGPVVNAQRDPLKWPFSKTSIWNMPIHKNAHYAPAGIPAPSQRGLTVDEDIIILDKSAPLTVIKIGTADWDRSKDRCASTGDTLFSAPIPADFVFNSGNWLGNTPNAGVAILSKDGKTIKNTQPFARCTTGETATSHYNYPDNDIFGDGIDGAHGGSGMAVLGGTLRLGELVPGGTIKHAIKINIDRHYLIYNEKIPGYRWPARKADGYANGGYLGSNPELCMGSLLALPPVVDIAKLGLVTEPAKILAKCLQDYGAYVVDDPYWDVVAIPVEHSPQGRVINEFKAKFGFDFETETTSDFGKDMAKIIVLLQVVTNNAVGNTGGGPDTDLINRRAPMAPDFK